MCNYKVFNYNPIYACHKLTFHNCFSEYRVYFTKLRGPYCRIRKGKTVNEYKSYTAEIEDHETERIKIIDSPDYLRNEK